MRKGNKIALFSLALAIILIVGSIGISAAYFTTTGKSINIITTGRISMVLHDERADGTPFPEEGLHGLLPSQVADKIVYTENDCEIDSYHRIYLEKIIKDQDGNTDTLSFDNIHLDINDIDWTLGDDGWYYYNSVIKPGDKSNPLFTTVTFGAELDNEYEHAEIDIIVHAQAVQSEHNGNTVLEAHGWPTPYFLTGEPEPTEAPGHDHPDVILPTDPNEHTSVRYENGAEHFIFNPEHKDLWFKFKNLIPGDTVEQKVEVRNGTKDKKVSIYLRAEAADAQYLDLFQYMTVTVMQGGKILQESPVAEPGGLENNVLLGTFIPDEATELSVILKVSTEMGNDHMDDYGEIIWVFTVEEEDYDNPQTGETFNTQTIICIACAVFLAAFIIAAQLVKKSRKDKNKPQIDEDDNLDLNDKE